MKLIKSCIKPGGVKWYDFTKVSHFFSRNFGKFCRTIDGMIRLMIMIQVTNPPMNREMNRSKNFFESKSVLNIGYHSLLNVFSLVLS